MKKAILLSVSLLLVLAIVAAALPVPAMAAGPTACQKTYIVKQGDTRASIAAATGMKWSDLATLNNIKPDHKLTAGDKICYNTTKKPAASLTATIVGDRIRVSARNAKSDQLYFVRARNASKTTGGWFDLGRFKAYKTMPSTLSFSVPKDLKGISPLEICFKEGETQKLTCIKATK